MLIPPILRTDLLWEFSLEVPSLGLGVDIDMLSRDEISEVPDVFDLETHTGTSRRGAVSSTAPGYLLLVNTLVILVGFATTPGCAGMPGEPEPSTGDGVEVVPLDSGDAGEWVPEWADITWVDTPRALAIPDATGDGIGDLAASAPTSVSGSAIAILDGTSRGRQIATEGRIILLDPVDEEDMLLWPSADLDADGFGDLFYSSLSDARYNGTEAWYIQHGPFASTDAGWDPEVSLSALELELQHLSSAQALGTQDLTGDLLPEVIIPFDGFDGELALLFSDPVSGAVDMSSPEMVFNGEGQLEAVAEAGDLDGDGIADLMLVYTAGEEVDSGGTMLRMASAISPGMTALDDLPTLTSLEGAQNVVVSQAGDVEGDGYMDVLVGVPFLGAQSGEEPEIRYDSCALLLSGPFLEAGTLEDASAAFTSHHGHFGTPVSSAGDVDGNGSDDVLIGGQGLTEADEDRLAAVLWLGPVSGALETEDAGATWLEVEISPEAELLTFGPMGDLDTDGADDFYLASYGWDGLRLGGGTVYGVLGPL